MPEAKKVISEPLTQITDFPNAIRRLQSILIMAESIGDTSPMLYEGKYKTPFFFLSAARQSIPDKYKSELIVKILDYEKIHDNDFIPTLRSYLLNQMDIGIVAEKLHIHRNTVSYRLKQIEELFDISLADSAVITELYLSLFLDLVNQQT